MVGLGHDEIFGLTAWQVVQTIRQRMRFQDRIAWTIGRLTGLGVNAPAKYPSMDTFLGIEKPQTPTANVNLWRQTFMAAGLEIVRKD